MTEQTMTPGEVLEVLDRAAGYILCSAGSEHEDYQNMHDAIDKLSELIAADVEYDEAMAELDEVGTHDHRRAVKAEERRAAALAACRGLA